MTIDLAKTIKAAESWLLNSGIQRVDPLLGTPGGMFAWFNKQTGAHSFLYSEITGYAITNFVHLYRRTGQQVYLDRANLAADWIIKEALEPEGAVKCRQDSTGWHGDLYAFDAGMCLNGLVNLYKCTFDPGHLSAARSIGEWLISFLRRDDGGFYSTFNSDNGSPYNSGEKWSSISGSFLVKLAIGLLNLGEVVAEEKFANAASSLCEWGLEFQQEDGRFNTAPFPSETFLHPHCYTAEGLLIAGTVLHQRRWLEGAARALSWIASHQLSDGGFPAHMIDGRFVSVTSPDITSQVLRLWCLLPEDLREECPMDLDAVAHSIIAEQCQDRLLEASGGFSAGSAWFHGQVEDHSGEHINSWVTMFSLQALSLSWTDGKEFDPYLLV